MGAMTWQAPDGSEVLIPPGWELRGKPGLGGEAPNPESPRLVRCAEEDVCDVDWIDLITGAWRPRGPWSLAEDRVQGATMAERAALAIEAVDAHVAKRRIEVEVCTSHVVEVTIADGLSQSEVERLLADAYDKQLPPLCEVERERWLTSRPIEREPQPAEEWAKVAWFELRGSRWRADDECLLSDQVPTPNKVPNRYLKAHELRRGGKVLTALSDYLDQAVREPEHPGYFDVGFAPILKVADRVCGTTALGPAYCFKGNACIAIVMPMRVYSGDPFADRTGRIHVAGKLT